MTDYAYGNVQALIFAAVWLAMILGVYFAAFHVGPWVAGMVRSRQNAILEQDFEETKERTEERIPADLDETAADMTAIVDAVREPHPNTSAADFVLWEFELEERAR